jgi:hypothetical protein
MGPGVPKHLDNASGCRHIELPVCFHTDIECRTGFADAAQHLTNLSEDLARQLAFRSRICPEGIVLAGRGALFHQLLRAPEVRLASARYVHPSVTRVDANPVVNLTAQQLMDRRVELFPGYVPKSYVNRADGRIQCSAERILFGGVHPAPELFGVVGALALQQRFQGANGSDHWPNRRRRRSFAPPVIAVFGCYTSTHDVAAPTDSQDIRFNGGDLQSA